MTTPRCVRTLPSLLGIALSSTWFASPALAEGRLRATDPSGQEVNLTLVQERVVVDIDRQHAHTELRQAWHNPSGTRVEGSYLLQAGKGATVNGFSYYNGEDRIVGEVFEKDTAAEVYRDVTGLGRDPGLLEQVGEGAFSFRVFPVEPDERKRVQIEWDRWMSRRGRVLEYRVALARPDARIDVRLDDPRGVRNVSSPTHHVRWDGGTGTVHVAARRERSHDFVLRWEVDQAPLRLDAALHRDPGQNGYLVMSVAAPAHVAAHSVVPKDVTLVIDRSGSMSGDPLEHARRAAVDVVGRLGPRDRINVVAFDDGVDALFPAPRPASAEVRTEVVHYIQGIHDAGGTDLAGALQHALGHQVSDDRPDVIVFLTDGQSDAQKTLKVARADAGDARVFTVGIGDGVHRPLLSRLAAEKRGRFTFVPDARAIESQMAGLYDRIAAPVVVDLELDAPGTRIERVYPKSLPDLFQGDELRIVARVRGEGPFDITLRGKKDGQPIAMSKTVAAPAVQRRPWVGRQWAMARVDDLLEEIALQGPGHGAELQSEVIELSLAYALAGPYTSFLAIPQSELTQVSSETLAQARARKQQILARNPDAAALSRRHMPPGDPILSVRAPRSARQVTARFSFGQVSDLVWNEAAEQWQVRFLVPKHVADGTYEVEIVIVHADGRIVLSSTNYDIDAQGPEFQALIQDGPDGTRTVRVVASEPLKEVTVIDPRDPQHRFQLGKLTDPTTFAGTVPDGFGARLRVVATDRARNESVSSVTGSTQP